MIFRCSTDVAEVIHYGMLVAYAVLLDAMSENAGPQ